MNTASHPLHSESGSGTSVARWITPFGEGGPAEAARRRGHHRLQIAVDTMAYAHNVPLRLLLPDRVGDLPAVVSKLLGDPAIQAVLASDAPEMRSDDYPSLGSARLLGLAADWILRLPMEKSAPPSDLPPHWLQGALALLPYVERKVWLTEMGNPLPGHALCRMQDHWAFYILMWTWRHADHLGRTESLIANALDVPGLEVRTLPRFMLQRPEGVAQPVVPVVGPYFVASDASAASESHETFCRRFGDFVENVVQIDRDRDGRSHTVPLHEELMDALGTRIGLTPAEAALRSATVARTLDLLLGAHIGDHAFADEMSRADWEVVAALCSWLARWDDALIEEMVPGQYVLLCHDKDIASLLVRTLHDDVAPAGTAPRLHVVVTHRHQAQVKAMALTDLLQGIEKQRTGVSRGTEFDAYRVDRPERYFSRIRERQNSMWSSQVIAINNLLSRHGPRDVYIGADEFAGEDEEGRARVRRGEARHLLRGFGGRICRYLVSMTRADAAAIYWLDYAQAPPRLLPAGDYARHALHRSQGHGIWEQFDKWAWAPGPELSNGCPANQRARSLSQVYRVAATGQEDPPPLEGEARTSGRRKVVVPVGTPGEFDGPQEAWADDPGRVPAYMKSYPEPSPVDSLAAPLLINGRVIGVVTLMGLVPGQFEPRLFWPLRRATGLIAACMNHQSQVWHMRRLNYLFTRQGLHEFQRRGSGTHDQSPLIDVSRCLANMFLCPVAHIWLQSASNPNRLELLGHNWDGMFRFGQAPAGFAREFVYAEERAVAEGEQPSFRPFASMAIDLARTQSGGMHPLGRFVQGYFDAREANTSGYNAECASMRGARLGRDYQNAGTQDADRGAALEMRRRVFGDAEQGGYQLLDIMAFALMSPDGDGWKTEGVVTLHDKGDNRRESLLECQPWDRGWASVVAHVQTYLPYLFKQAEVLNNPEVDARRYLIHAGRAELIAVRDNMTRLRQRLESVLAPDRGVRRMLDKVMSPGFSGDHRDVLRPAQVTVAEAWETLGLAASPNWEQNIRQLANVMHEYRNLSALAGVKLTAGIERLNLRALTEETIARFAHEFKHRRSKRLNIPERLEVSVSGQWLRIVLRDLIHNAAKYATGDSFNVDWEADSRTLTLVNEGPYQSDVDRAENLLAPGGQGSAGRRGRAVPFERGEPADRRGHGLGLWGARLLCDVMDIGFSIDPRPMSATVSVDANGVRRGTARYVVKLAFPVSAVSGAQPAPKGFY